MNLIRQEMHFLLQPIFDGVITQTHTHTCTKKFKYSCKKQSCIIHPGDTYTLLQHGSFQAKIKECEIKKKKTSHRIAD